MGGQGEVGFGQAPLATSSSGKQGHDPPIPFCTPVLRREQLGGEGQKAPKSSKSSPWPSGHHCFSGVFMF